MPDNDFFLIHGGSCCLRDGKLHFDLGIFASENIYKIYLFISIFLFTAAIYSYFTGWIYYGKMVPIPWNIFLLFGFLFNYTLIIRGYLILTGFTFDKDIPLDSIKSIEFFHNESKMARVRSNILFRYNKDGKEKKRRITLYEKETFGSKDDVSKAINFLERHGLKYQYKQNKKTF